ncbi:mitochondrial import protein Pam17, partial [Fistulina hepatica ATCC 64428]
WTEYFKLRAARRRWQNAMTIPTSIFGLTAGAAYFGSLDTDPMKMIMGLDPFMFYGLCTAGASLNSFWKGLGFLAGPTLGGTLWRMANKKSLPVVDARDNELFERIAKNRVDPALQSPTSPVPDFYGEKITSVAKYRRWLRDQAKYRRK